MDAIEKVEQINDDFVNKNGPFADVTFPEERLLDEIECNSKEDALGLISMFASFDYNRDANQLVDNIIELREEYGKPFTRAYFISSYHPDIVHRKSVSEVFEEIGFRYPNRDAKAWKKNCEIIHEQYNNSWSELLLETGCDALNLVEQLEEDGFHVLKGDKVAPMYCRIIDDYIAPMEGLWLLDIPTDTHIIRLTEDLTGEEMSKDDIRAWWNVVAAQIDLELHTIDGGLWLIGSEWDDWGEEYWNSFDEPEDESEDES